MSRVRDIQVGEPHRPVPVKLINFVGRAATRLGLRPVALEPEALLSFCILPPRRVQ